MPVMSAGIRSGVNWIRWNLRWKTCAIVRTSSVLARPGAPVIRQWPPANRLIRSWCVDLLLADDDLGQLALDPAAALVDLLDDLALVLVGIDVFRHDRSFRTAAEAVRADVGPAIAVRRVIDARAARQWVMA